MSALTSLGSPGSLVAVAFGGIFLVLVLWFGWRKPTWLFVFALASLALRPQLLWGGPEVGYEWGLHQSLIAFALAMNALRYGVRRSPNWPILALIATFGLSLAFGNLHPKLTLPFMLMSLAILTLPFAFTQVVLEPGSRRVYGLAIMLLPLLSVALGGVLQATGLREVFRYGEWVGNSFRLEGATGNAAVFATLAFAGLAVALHEWTRPGRPHAGYLASLNLMLVILSGTRMAIFASAVLVTAYAAVSPTLREQVWQYRKQSLLGMGLVAAIAVAYLPTLEARMFDGEELQLSSRDEIWSFYWTEFLLSPAVGRGIGSGFIAAADWLPSALPTPHNEYLQLLVTGGVVGFALCSGAIALWCRQLWQASSPNDRQFLLALTPALALYALTDNILIYSSALALYVYLGVVLTAPSLLMPAARDSGPAPFQPPADFSHQLWRGKSVALASVDSDPDRDFPKTARSQAAVPGRQ